MLNHISPTVLMYERENMHRSGREGRIRDLSPSGFLGLPLVSGIVCLLISEVSLGTLMWKVGCV